MTGVLVLWIFMALFQGEGLKGGTFVEEIDCQNAVKEVSISPDLLAISPCLKIELKPNLQGVKDLSYDKRRLDN